MWTANPHVQGNEQGRGGRTVTELMAIVDGEAIEEEPNWQERALCAQTDPEAFFPEKGGSTREAKKVCLGCDVRGECLEYALQNDERFGIWGGLSERERRKLKKKAVWRAAPSTQPQQNFPRGPGTNSRPGPAAFRGFCHRLYGESSPGPAVAVIVRQHRGVTAPHGTRSSGRLGVLRLRRFPDRSHRRPDGSSAGPACRHGGGGRARRSRLAAAAVRGVVGTQPAAGPADRGRHRFHRRDRRTAGRDARGRA